MALVPISGQWDEEGRYTPSDDEVEQGMARWHMRPGDEGLVWHWLKSLRENTFLATALYFPYQWQGIMGVFLCLAWYSATSTVSEIQTRCISGFWRMYSIICAPKLV